MKDKKHHSDPDISIGRDPKEKLFEKIYRDYGKRIRYYIQIRLPNDPDQCDDITQLVLLKLYKNLHRYKPFYPLRPWVFTITQNVLIDYLRGMKRRAEVIMKKPVDLEKRAGPFPDPLEEIILTEEKQMVDAYIDGLNWKDRQIAFLRFHEEMKIGRISQILRIPAGTVKYRIYRIRQGLKDFMEGENER